MPPIPVTRFDDTIFVKKPKEFNEKKVYNNKPKELKMKQIEENKNFKAHLETQNKSIHKSNDAIINENNELHCKLLTTSSLSTIKSIPVTSPLAPSIFNYQKNSKSNKYNVNSFYNQDSKFKFNKEYVLLMKMFTEWEMMTSNKGNIQQTQCVEFQVCVFAFFLSDVEHNNYLNLLTLFKIYFCR